jgi:hypothetical protein
MHTSYYSVPIAMAVMFGVVIPAWKAYSRKRNERQGPPGAQVDVPSGQGSVTVRRPHAGLHAAARSFSVDVDGVARGKVKSGKAVALALAPGTHSVRVRMGRKRSDSLNFQITEGARVIYETEFIADHRSSKLDLRPV